VRPNTGVSGGAGPYIEHFGLSTRSLIDHTDDPWP
jgi:hypothetical protein